jgi:hypothetical protein
MARRSRSSRSRDLAGLAALGALGYTFFGPGRERKSYEVPASQVPVDYLGTDRPPSVRGDMSPADLYADAAARLTFDDDREPGGSTYRPPAAVAPVAAAAPAPAAPAASVARSITAAAPAAARSTGSGSGYLDLGGYNDMAQVDMPRGYDPRLANLSSAAVGASEASAIRNAANAEMPLRRQLTQTTLGAPTARAAGAPSIYAGPAAFQAYRQRQAAEAAAAATPPAPPGSARNIVQQMREKDKAVLAAVRRRQEQEAAAAAQNRAAAEQRRIDAALSLDPMERLARGFKKGGAVKAKPKKMASGGVSSASKRADGIASKGKTKCKMY